MGKRATGIGLAVLLVSAGPAAAQYFGPNKVQYENFDFQHRGPCAKVGVRADVRYFHAFGDNALENALNLSPTTSNDNSPISILLTVDCRLSTVDC